MVTFAPTKAPSYSSSTNKEFRVLSADFGDGYANRVGDGLNVAKQSWNLTWNLLTTAEADDITDFFDTQAGVTSFNWVDLNGDNNTYIVREYSRSFVAFNSHTVTATLEQVFGS